MSFKKSINLNYISPKIEEDKLNELKKLYKYYHKLYTCYKWKYKKYRKIRLSLNMTSASSIVIGSIVGGVTVNPIVLGCITGSGVLIQGYITKSNINKKVEMCRFAYTSYSKILTQLKSYLQGLEFDDVIFLSDVKVVDDIIVDLCPTINGMSVKYDKLFTC